MLRRRADRPRSARRAGAPSPATWKWARSRATSSRRSAPPGFWKTRTFAAHAGRAAPRIRRSAGARARARGVGLSRPSRRTCARPWRGTWPAMPARRPRAAADGLFAIAAPHVSPAGRLAILPRRVPHAAARAPRPHLRDPGHLALRRARELRPDAQDLPHAAGRRAHRPAAWWTGWPRAAATAWRWRITATPSSTPWNCRWSSCSTCWGPACGSCRFCAAPSRTACTRAACPKTTTA